MYFDISGYDNYAIWQMNLTIKNLSNDVQFTNFTTDISLSSDINYFNITGYPD
ncbi:unnamed protein product, partial [marine sediment metagenome]